MPSTDMSDTVSTLSGFPLVSYRSSRASVSGGQGHGQGRSSCVLRFREVRP